jgi:hypothetical protein
MKCRWLNSGAVIFISSRVKPAVLFFFFLVCLKVQLSWYVAIKIKCTQYENTVLKKFEIYRTLQQGKTAALHILIPAKAEKSYFPIEY